MISRFLIRDDINGTYREGNQIEIDAHNNFENMMIIATGRAQAKERRKQSINHITVTTSTGNIFDGDETSQQRMHRAIEITEENETIEWILADNTKATVTRAELREALRLAFLKQADLHINQTET